VQFREQGKKIQCIRSTYDPASKRSHQKVVAAFDRWADKLPSSGLEGLTDAERQELAAWFDARQSAKAERMNQYRASVGGQTLAELADAIRAAGTLTDDQAAAVWRGLADVAKALRKAGHPKPKRGRAAPVALPGQADLLADAAEPAPAVLPPASTAV
jgi:hypothetical protein